MQLRYEFVCVTNDLTRRGVEHLLQEEYDFAYALLMPGGKRLFREDFPKVDPVRLPLEVLLFRYEATEEGQSLFGVGEVGRQSPNKFRRWEELADWMHIMNLEALKHRYTLLRL